MAFTIKNPPEFTVEVEQWTRETLADGEEMAKVIEKLLNNEIYNKSISEKVKGKILTGIAIPLSGWENLSYTIEDESITPESTVYIGYSYDSIPIAQKANIRGKAEMGRLVLTAKKMPSGNLLADEIRILNLREV